MRISAADQFCGAGGFSTGLRWAIEELERESGQTIHLDLVAINHWDVAIATHKANHPSVKHICDELENANPKTLFPSGKLRLLLSAPECTHFSRALGGKPRNWQSRATSKYVIKWASQLDIQDIIVENVREFKTWGPLHRTHSRGCSESAHNPKKNKHCHFGKPIKNRKGQFFNAFIRKLESLSYVVEHRPLVCADYGDATSRTRLFIRARKRRAIRWPAITHAHTKRVEKLSRGLGRPIQPYRTALEIIDWGDLGQSIFNRAKPLADNTLRRIYAGFNKFSGLPFLLPNEGFFRGNVARGLDDVIPTVTAERGAGHVVQPYLVPFHKEREGQAPRTHPVDAPTPTIATQRTPLLVQPFLVKLYNTNTAAAVDGPVPTITAGGQHIGLAQPFLFAMEHSTDASGHDRRVFEPDKPINTLSARAAFGLAQPFLFHMDHATQLRPALSVDETMRTITSSDSWGLAQPQGYIVPVNHGPDARTHSIDESVRTITSVDAFALATPFLVKFYGNEKDGQSLGLPLGTTSSRDHFALCVPLTDGFALLDIYFRMLKPIELARAHSLGHYTFVGSREKIVKQIGNSVPSMTAKHLCYSALT